MPSVSREPSLLLTELCAKQCYLGIYKAIQELDRNVPSKERRKGKGGIMSWISIGRCCVVQLTTTAQTIQSVVKA